jgi:hypothetical protein
MSNVFRSSAAVLLLLSLLCGREAVGCETMVVEIPQVAVRRAGVVAEATATAEQFTFRITKVWKGTASEIIKLTGIKPTGSSCDTYKPTVAGRQYLLLIESAQPASKAPVMVFPGTARAYEAEEFPAMLNYLSHPLRVSRRDVLDMMRGWRNGTISDTVFARWLRETAPVAEVDDWIAEHSLNLSVIRELNVRINERGVGLDKLSCELTFLRERVVPALIEALGARHLTPEMIDVLDRDYPEDDLCSGG